MFGKGCALLAAAAVSLGPDKAIPLTGDISGILLPAMGVLLAVSAVLVVVYVVLSKKKK